MGFWYDPKRDGTIEQYLEQCRNSNVPFAFKGLKHYEALCKSGRIVPEISSIRLCYNHARSDEFYTVAEDFKLEGVELQQHSGKKGIHDPKEIFSDDAPYWEASMLNPHPTVRG